MYIYMLVRIHMYVNGIYICIHVQIHVYVYGRRFDRHVVVPNPDVKGRTQILNLHLSSVPVDKGVKVSFILH